MKPFRKILSLPPWMAAVFGFLILIPSVSQQSIDMDEGKTWDYARISSLPEVWHALSVDPNSESQMPLGMLTAWAWSRMFGTGERAMRSLNLIWVAIALAALCLVARQTGINWLPLFFAIQPFVWYLMDRARTPMMQMAGGALLLAGALELLQPRFRWLRTALLVSLGSIILCGASMLGVVPLAVVMLFLLAAAAWKKVFLSRGLKIVLFVTGGILGVLGLYYISTLVRGAGGIKLWAVTPANLVFVAYEFFGYAALGPGRQELRAILRGMAPASEIWYFVPGWLALTAAYAAVILAAGKSWLTRIECMARKPSLRLWGLCVVVPVLSGILLYCLATAVGFPFWGRHLAGVYPFFVTAFAVVLHWSNRGIWRRMGRGGVVGVVAILILASGLMRFHLTHRHDDYRQAAESARGLATPGQTVWWVADHSGGSYYGLQFADEGPGIRHAHNLNVGPESLPDAIIISRPENFDMYETANEMLRSGTYERLTQFQAFEVWRRVER